MKSLLEAGEDAPKVTDTFFGKVLMSIIWVAAVVAVWNNWVPVTGILLGILVGIRIKRLILKRTPAKSELIGLAGNIIFWWGMLDHSFIMMTLGVALSVKVNLSRNGKKVLSLR